MSIKCLWINENGLRFNFLRENLVERIFCDRIKPKGIIDKKTSRKNISKYTINRYFYNTDKYLRLIPTPASTHILSALVFGAQSPYSGRQNVVNSRNVIRNAT
jgi:hypothetical protein